MPNLGQSLVYSPGRMKAVHITDSSVLFKSRYLFVFPLLLNFDFTEQLPKSKYRDILGIMPPSFFFLSLRKVERIDAALTSVWEM